MERPIVHLPGQPPPTPRASKVVITLANYHPATAGALMAAYGDDWISVVPSSARYVPLGGSAR